MKRTWWVDSQALIMTVVSKEGTIAMLPGPTRKPSPRMLINAQLIVAAPDLLLACEMALKQLAPPIDYKLLLVLEAAIGKAKGKL